MSSQIANGHHAPAAIQHPLDSDPLRSNAKAENSMPREAVPRRRGSRRGQNNQCTLFIARSAPQQQQKERPQQRSSTSDAKRKQTKRPPRSVRWRLSLGLLTKPTMDSNDKDSLLKSVEDLNALKLRCQRSRYDELEKKHYWKSTPMGIADETKRKGEYHAADSGGATHVESLHHVAPGDDPLSALLQDNGPGANKNKGEEKKQLFGGNGIFGGKKDKGARDRTRSTGSLSKDDYLKRSSSDGDEDACKGSRWADFYSTREVLDVIEKDLIRLPSDHHKMYHEWRIKDKGWKEHRERDEQWKREQYSEDREKEMSTSLHSLPEDEESVQSKQPWSLGNSFNLALLRTKSAENMSALLDIGDDLLDEEQKRKDDAKAELKTSIKDRADRISQILFVYAREHPEIGYRQGMHEILSYILLALEIDLLEQAVIMEKKRWKRNSLPFGMPGTATEGVDGGMAGVDSSGNIVVVRLLDPAFIVHDAFNMFECIMTALAPAYDAMPVGDDMAASMFEEAQAERGESPMENTVNSIMSKIRYVARDEQLFSHVLYMPVPPQLYFAKWVRLMFCREVDGGMKSVLTLWGAFFDLAAASAALQEDVLITTALLDVLKTAGASMIVLIRDKLLAPTILPNGMMGEPDPNEGIGFLMNYPPITDIGTLVETISVLMSREKKLIAQPEVTKEKSQLSKERKLSKQYLPSESYKISSIVEHPLDETMGGGVDGKEKEVHAANQKTESLLSHRNANGNGQLTEALPKMQEEFPQVHRTNSYNQTPKHDVAESLGHFAELAVDFGAKTASAAIASIQQQIEGHNAAVDHPLQNRGTSSEPIKQSGDYVIRYRPYEPAISEQDTAEVTHLPVGDKLQSEIDIVQQLIGTESRAEVEATEELEEDSVASKLSASQSVGDSVQKSPAQLASLLEKSVEVLMAHFNERLSNDADAQGDIGNSQHSSSVIPETIWDAMADIDLVRKELVSQAAIAAIEHSRSSSSLKSSGNSQASGSRRRTRRSSSGLRASRPGSWKL